MQSLTVLIQHHQHRKTKPLGITQFFQVGQVLVFLAIVQVINDVIAGKDVFQCRVRVDKRIEFIAPAAPVTANLQQHVFIFHLCFYQGGRNVFLHVCSRVVWPAKLCRERKSAKMNRNRIEIFFASYAVIF